MLRLDDAKQFVVAVFAAVQGVDWIAGFAAALVIVSLLCKVKEFMGLHWPWEDKEEAV